MLNAGVTTWGQQTIGLRLISSSVSVVEAQSVTIERNHSDQVRVVTVTTVLERAVASTDFVLLLLGYRRVTRVLPSKVISIGNVVKM